jgi:hypothetical protein
MGLSGTSLLARVAMNPRCPIQVAMGLSDRAENRFYEAVTGRPFDGEFGERQSAQRRGRKFEENLFRPPGEATLLREAVSEIVGLTPAQMYIRDLEQEVPGISQDVRVQRLARTRAIISDALAGRPHPHVVIQPQFLIPTRPGPKPYFFVSPDYMVWEPSRQAFINGDAKSFVVRHNEVDPGDLERTRLQLASQVLGLRHEFGRHNAADRIRAEGILTFSTPYGLRPHRPTIQDLRGALDAVERGLDAFLMHRRRIIQLAAGAPPHLIVDQLEPALQEKCVTTCVMFHYCRARNPGKSLDLGDAAAELFGPTADLDRLVCLMTGTVQPANPGERQLAMELRRVASVVDPQGRAA